MFGSLGMPELLLILVIALIVFGPKKLPEVGRSLGKAMREFKRTTEDIKGKFEEQLNAEEFKDIKSGLNDIKAEIKSATELPSFAPTPSETGVPSVSGTPEHPATGAAPTAAPASPPAPPSETPTPPASSTPSAPAEVTSQHGEG